MLDSNTWTYLTVSTKKIELRLVKKYCQQNVITNDIYLIYMYKQDLALNNLQWLICHKTKPNQTKPFIFLSMTFVLDILRSLIFNSEKFYVYFQASYNLGYCSLFWVKLETMLSMSASAEMTSLQEFWLFISHANNNHCVCTLKRKKKTKCKSRQRRLIFLPFLEKNRTKWIYQIAPTKQMSKPPLSLSLNLSLSLSLSLCVIKRVVIE